jgi:hypothetical protein
MCMYVSCRSTNYCTRKFLADGPEVRRECRIGGGKLKCRFSSREIIASKESVSSISIRARAILSCSIGLLSNSDWSQAAFCGLPVMPFISRVSFWRRAGSRLLGQEVHLISQNGKFAIRKSYGACNCNEKDTRCNRRPRGRTGRDMSVQVKRVFIMSMSKISNRRLLQAETRSSTKGGLAPSWRACRSLAGVKPDVGAFNRRQHMEVTTNAGEWVRANAYYHNMEQRIWGLQYWLRRWVAANRQKIAVK